jgi:dihydroorotate dehydrogenase
LSLISGNSTYCWNVVCHPFLIPKIGDSDMIRSLEGFTFASILELNIGYYHMKLGHEANAQKLCTIVFPWHMGKFKYKPLPMGIKISPDIFETSCLSLSKIWNMLKPILMIC